MSETFESDALSSRTLSAGAQHRRAYVGPPDQYDFMGATQFMLAVGLGLREEHTVLDVGCGSLRSGRLLLQYLLPDRYCGIEPNEWLWREAVDVEIGRDILAIKRPTFSDTASFEFDVFNKTFDFIIAQSIFSHAGDVLFNVAMSNAKKTLGPEGQFLFTVLDEGSPGYGDLPNGKSVEGWLYPECCTYRQEDVLNIAAQNGMCVQKLPWFHPRQQWYRAVQTPEQMLADGETLLANGKILFDSRF